MKIIKIIFFALIAVIVAGVLVVGYFGFIPGVSAIFGSDKPRNLGVSYTAADLQSANGKIGVTHTVLTSAGTPKDSIKFSGQKPLQGTFTDKELTALMNSETWAYYPVKNAQLKFSQDGTIEFSAALVRERIAPYVQATGGPSGKDISEATKFLAGNTPIYIKGKAEMANNAFTTFALDKAEVGRLDLTSIARDNQSQLISFIEARIRGIIGLEVASGKIAAGQFVVNGKIYESRATVNK